MNYREAIKSLKTSSGSLFGCLKFFFWVSLSLLNAEERQYHLEKVPSEWKLSVLLTLSLKVNIFHDGHRPTCVQNIQSARERERWQNDPRFFELLKDISSPLIEIINRHICENYITTNFIHVIEDKSHTFLSSVTLFPKKT